MIVNGRCYLLKNAYLRFLSPRIHYGLSEKAVSKVFLFSPTSPQTAFFSPNGSALALYLNPLIFQGFFKSKAKKP